MKKAIISVTDKENIIEFAKGLIDSGYEIISTGGTFAVLNKAGIAVINIEDITKFPEILDGRVKTLNPFVHGGILYRRDLEKDQHTIKEFGIESIDLVCVNLYKFQEAVEQKLEEEKLIEEIDIGGPTLIRAAAKNYKDVVVVTDTKDYPDIINKIQNNTLDLTYRRGLAAKAFKLIANYDISISSYFNKNMEYLQLEENKKLSYGENPHQEAEIYKLDFNKQSMMDLEQLWGKEMSYNNYNDTFAALELLHDFKDEKYFSCSIKHSTVCGAAAGINDLDSYQKCYQSDSIGIFGGIVALNYKVDEAVAIEINKIFIEILIAPDFTKEALDVLKTKKNIRILKYFSLDYFNKSSYKDLDGYLLKQTRDFDLYEELKYVTVNKPSDSEMDDLLFAYKIVKNIKSNGIALVKDKVLTGVSGGQTARVYALKAAIDNSVLDISGSVLASDAFFPFNDSVEFASNNGIKSIIQPGGSKNDSSLIEFCNKNKIKMVFTNRRHFKH